MRLAALWIVALFLVIVGSPAHAEVLFEDNFDAQDDWTTTVPADGGCFTPEAVCDNPPPTNWSGYYNGLQRVSGGNNNLYIDAIAGYPYESAASTCRGGGGKCITYWDEAEDNVGFNQSDGQLIVELGDEYPEVYLRFYIKFGRKSDGSDYSILHSDSETSAHKLMHLQHYVSGAPWQYFTANQGNCPTNSGGFNSWASGLGNMVQYKSYMGYRGWCNEGTYSPTCLSGCYYLQGSPAYSYDVGCSMDHEIVDASFDNIIGDGTWHSLEWRFKTNSDVGEADGIYQFWYDGDLIDSRTIIPFNQVGATEVRGWRLVSVGGNSYLYWAGCDAGAGECEQWYAIDDVVISDAYIGPDYEIGGSTISGGTVTGVRVY